MIYDIVSTGSDLMSEYVDLTNTTCPILWHDYADPETDQFLIYWYGFVTYWLLPFLIVYGFCYGIMKDYIYDRTLYELYGKNDYIDKCISKQLAKHYMDTFVFEKYGYMFFLRRIVKSIMMLFSKSKTKAPRQNTHTDASNRSRYIVVVTGRKRNGKDTVGDYLIKSYGFHRVAVADPLKEMSRQLCGFSDDQLYGDMKDTTDKIYGFSPRYVFQTLGPQFCLDMIGDTCLITKALHYIDKYDRIVFTDVRYVKDVELIRKYGAVREIPVIVIKKTRESVAPQDDPAENCIDAIIPDIDITGEYDDVTDLYHVIDAIAGKLA
jgi:hypothetical protein